jgi:hypothetical protein
MLIAFLAVLAAAPAQCAPVQLSAEGETTTFIAQFANNSDGFRKTSANFAAAYAQACKEGLLNKPLIGAKDPDRKHLFLHNAPDANVASIYSVKQRTLLEYPFLSPDGKLQIPTQDELHEAIYCAVHGASPKEQEESGRCLPD